MKRLLPFFLIILSALPARAKTVRFAGPAGQTLWRTQQIVQDSVGFLWLSTWNGLYRFDGYEFHNFKSHPGDRVEMVSDRMRDLWLGRNGELICRIDENWYRFSLRTCRFTECTKEEAVRERTKKGKFIRRKNNDFNDRQGIRWYSDDDVLCKDVLPKIYWDPIPQEKPTPVGALCMTPNGSYWISTKVDATLRLYSKDNQLIGYLGKDGRLHKEYTSFQSPIYCIYHSTDGTLWLGSKPDGLFSYNNGELRHWQLPSDTIYDIREDNSGRLWVATFGAGLVYGKNGTFHRAKNYPKTEKARVRNIKIICNTLLATTTEGLVVGDISKAEPEFRLHHREAGRATSLSSNPTMDICADKKGRIWITTESGGLNLITSKNLCAEQLEFKHFSKDKGLPTDILQSATPLADGSLLLVGNRQIIRFTTDGCENFGESWFGEPMEFSDAHPIVKDDGTVIIGRMDGALIFNLSTLHHSHFVPPLVITGISIQNKAIRTDVAYLDTLTMSSDERNLTVRFAALDYRDSEGIRYSIRMDGSEWIDLGETRQATFFDLEPGTHILEIRSTNADGIVVNNARMLVITVTPRFTETTVFKILVLLIVCVILFIMVRTIMYIRTIRRKQKETFEAYMALLEKHAGDKTETAEDLTATPTAANSISPEDEEFINRILSYVEANISNSDANIDSMAQTALVSRSVLNRKMKSLMNITPNQFLLAARMQRAATLLKNKNLPVSEVAWKCGFTDPKYFSKCFKSWSGKSPSQY